MTQLLVYGANVVLVKGDYADAHPATAAIKNSAGKAGTARANPYLVEGKNLCDGDS